MVEEIRQNCKEWVKSADQHLPIGRVSLVPKLPPLLVTKLQLGNAFREAPASRAVPKEFEPWQVCLCIC
jgi:hypothetical protein